MLGMPSIEASMAADMGSAVDHVDGVIGPMVDTAEADIGFAVQDLIYRQFHTINGGAGSLPGFTSPKMDILFIRRVSRS